jgi:hypothetical protein
MTAEDRMASAWRKILYALVIVVVLVVALTVRAFAQHVGHPPEHMALHEKFYKNWHMPDNRKVSCCHDEDCKPAESHKRNGQWYARQVGDTGEFTPIPPNKVDSGLPDSPDNPDGRSHLCGRRYGFNEGGFTVFCFQPGSGT